MAEGGRGVNCGDPDCRVCREPLAPEILKQRLESAVLMARPIRATRISTTTALGALVLVVVTLVLLMVFK